MAPIVYPEYRYFMGAVLSVELNTWLLILRRVLFLRKDSPYVPTQLRDCVDYAFYFSWIVIRVFVFNWVLFSLVAVLIERFEDQRTMLFLTMFVATQAALNALQLKWTYDLFVPMIKRSLWKASSSENGKTEHTL